MGLGDTPLVSHRVSLLHLLVLHHLLLAFLFPRAYFLGCGKYRPDRNKMHSGAQVAASVSTWAFCLRLIFFAEKNGRNDKRGHLVEVLEQGRKRYPAVLL